MSISSDDVQLLTAILEDPESPKLKILFDKYRPMISALLADFQFRFLDQDDAFAIALTVCFNSVRSFDVTKKVTFGAFFKNNLRNEFLSIARRQAAQKRAADLNAYSYDTMLSLYPNFTNTHMTHLSPEERLALKEELKNALNDFSYLENKVFYNYLTTSDQKQAAKNLHISEQTYVNAVNRCRNKIKQNFEIY